MDLIALKERLEERARIASEMHATAPVSDVLKVVIAELDGIEDGPTTPQAPDRMLTAPEAALMLNVTPRWLYRNAPRLPFAKKLSRKCVRFSEAGLRRYRDRPRAA